MRRLLGLLACVAVVGCGGSDANIGDGGDGAATDTGSQGDAPIADAPADVQDAGAAPDAADGAPDSGPPMVTRLFVTTQAGVAIWNNPDAIAADVAPTTTLSDTSVASAKSRGMALLGKRLFVGATGNPVIVAWDSADTVSGNAAPSVSLPSSAVTGINNVFDSIYVDPGTNTLWPVSFNNGAQVFINASTLNSSAFSRAQLTHSFQQLPGFAFDSASKRLFQGQISGAGMLAWNNADTKIGIFSTPDFTVVQNLAFWSIAIAQSRMYGASSTSPVSIAVWTNVGNVSAPTAPAFSLSGAGSGLPANNGFIPHVAVTNDVLVVTLQGNLVNVYKNASTLAGQTVPTAAITTNVNQPKKTVLSKSNKLYILDTEGVAIFKDVTTTPTFVAKVKMGLNAPKDIVLME
jgi:hypothetical protein